MSELTDAPFDTREPSNGREAARKIRTIWLTTLERSGAWLYCGTEDEYFDWINSVQPRAEFRWGHNLGNAMENIPTGVIGNVTLDLRFVKSME